MPRHTRERLLSLHRPFLVPNVAFRFVFSAPDATPSAAAAHPLSPPTQILDAANGLVLSVIASRQRRHPLPTFSATTTTTTTTTPQLPARSFAPCQPTPPQQEPPRKKQRSNSISSLASSTASAPAYLRLSSPEDDTAFVPFDLAPPTPPFATATPKAVTPQGTVPHTAPPKQSPCDFCHTTRTGQWRRGPRGLRTLCNACGINWCRKARAYAKAEACSIEAAELAVGADQSLFRRVVA